MKHKDVDDDDDDDEAPWLTARVPVSWGYFFFLCWGVCFLLSGLFGEAYA